MKKLAILLLLTSCAVLNPERYSLCSNMAGSLGNGGDWVNQCMSNDGVYMSGFRQVARKSTPQELCVIGQEATGAFERSAIEDTIREKKINCSPIIASVAQTAVQNLSMTDLCLSWNAASDNKEVTNAIRQEVKSRQVDCPAVLSSVAQQQQAQGMERMYQQQLMNAQQRQATPTYQRPIRTDCKETITGISCMSQPGGVDTSVFGNTRSISDYMR